MKNVILCFCFLFSYTLNAYSQGTTCANATPFCTAVGTPFTYVNSTTGSLGSLKCLQTTPGPNWFYIKTTTPGTYVFSITQSTSPGGSANIDVDFVAFGPYSALQCTFGSGGGGLTNDCTSLGSPYGEVEDCSYCWDAVETMTLVPTSNCRIYMIMVTNYSRTAGYITFTQTSGPATDCNITNVSWTAPTTSMCVDAAPIDLNTLITGGATGGTWSGPGVTGNTFNPATAGAGSHSVTYTVQSGLCPTSVSHTITVTSAATPTFTALGPYCVGSTPGSLSGTSTNSITGTWSPSTISTSTAGTTVYTFTPTAGQCAPSTTMSVNVTSSITPTFSALGPYCIGSTPSILPTTSTNGINGSWSPSTISTSTAGTTVYTFTPNAGQCGAQVTMSIDVNSSLTPTFVALGPYCLGATPGVLPTTSNNGISGTWNPSVISTATVGTTLYTFTPTASGCAVNTSMNITISTQIVPNFPNIPAFCAGTVPPSLGLTSPNGVSGTWSPSSISNTTSGTYVFTPNAGQCASTQTLNVTVSTQTVSDFAEIPPFCAGSNAPLLPSTSPNGLIGTWNPPIINNTTNGSYTFTPNGGTQCITPQTLNVIVTPIPSVLINASNDTICLGQSVDLSASGAVNYMWQPDSMNTATIHVIPSITTTYTVTGDVNGCISSSNIVIYVYPFPEILFTSDIFEGCEDLLVQFTDLSNSNGTTWNWNFGDNNFSNIQNPSHVYTHYGIFDVTLTLTSIYGCSSSYTWYNMINVFEKPIASFTMFPESTSELEPLVWFFDHSSGADNWFWNFGDINSPNNTSTNQNTAHIYSDTGSFRVMLIVTSNEGCADTATHIVSIVPNVSFYIPNTFTPNNDPDNQIFTIFGEGIDWNTFEMLIFNRWGEQICYTRDHVSGWNGKYKGYDVQEGVYVWLIRFTDIKSKEHKLKGIVNLLR